MAEDYRQVTRAGLEPINVGYTMYYVVMQGECTDRAWEGQKGMRRSLWSDMVMILFPWLIPGH